MQSDERTEMMLKLMSAARETYRSAIRLAIEQVRGFLSACRDGSSDLTIRAEAELGEFAAGRVDARRFASLFVRSEVPSPLTVDAVTDALEVLEQLDAAGDSLFVVGVAPGEDLRRVVDEALASAGRAFGAARVVELARTRRYNAELHERMLDRFPFRSWNRAERRLAPPLVVRISGNDLSAASIADYLDGAMKIVLLVDAPASPAPLVRLVTPGTFVMQTADAAAITRALDSTAPAIAAVMPPPAAQFTHDPAAGREVWQRLTVTERPKAEPRHALGGISAAQQADELRLLDALSTAPKSVDATLVDRQSATAATPASPADPVDRLAAWLLQQVQPELVVAES